MFSSKTANRLRTICIHWLHFSRGMLMLDSQANCCQGLRVKQNWLWLPQKQNLSDYVHGASRACWCCSSLTKASLIPGFSDTGSASHCNRCSESELYLYLSICTQLYFVLLWSSSHKGFLTTDMHLLRMVPLFSGKGISLLDHYYSFSVYPWVSSS